MQRITEEDIILAAKHVFRADSTEYELEHDAPRIMAVAWRYGLRIRVRYSGYDHWARIGDTHVEHGEAEYWQEACAPLLSGIEIEGQIVCDRCPGWVEYQMPRAQPTQHRKFNVYVM